MALTLFLFKISDLYLLKKKSETSLNSTTPLIQITSDDSFTLISAKVIFRGIHLWSNNVELQNGTANFLSRGEKPKKFIFNLASMLIPEDKVRMEFYSITLQKNRKKLVAVFEFMLESLITLKHMDLVDENLMDANNRLLPAKIQLKLIYRIPNLTLERGILLNNDDEESAIIDWMACVNDEDEDDYGRHGGHRHRYIHSRREKRL